MGKSAIEWTDDTWNPVRGCSRVSEGCRHCYAEQQAARIVRMGKGAPTPYDGLVKLVGGEARWTGEVRMALDHLADPLKWKRPRRIFANSMSDLFHENLADSDVDQVLAVMLLAPRHTFQVLTKRPARMRSYLSNASLYDRVLAAAGRFRDVSPQLNQIAIENPATRPARWIWWGTSVENQDAANERIPDLLATPAAVRFLSCEPLLGPVDLTHRAANHALVGATARRIFRSAGGKDETGIPAHLRPPTSIDLVIAGCESGPGARPCSVEWLRSLRDQCAAASVPFFLKQAVEQIQPLMSDGSHEEMPPYIIGPGEGSHRKPRGIIGLPYLDGVQHKGFPE